MSLPADLGVATHLDAIKGVFGSVAGLELLDVGCGDSSLPSALAAQGASCTGIDPFMPPRAWQSSGEGRWRILQASAEALPLPDASVDGVLYIFSLHHVPAAVAAGAFEEARRVMKPGGILYIAEPLAEGDFNQLLSTFHDECEVRAAAQTALRAASPLFLTHGTSAYTARRRFADFGEFSGLMRANTRFNSYRDEDVTAAPVKAQYEAIAARTGGVFDQPVKVDVLA